MQESNLRHPVLETGALPLSEYGMKKALGIFCTVLLVLGERFIFLGADAACICHPALTERRMRS